MHPMGDLCWRCCAVRLSVRRVSMHPIVPSSLFRRCLAELAMELAEYGSFVQVHHDRVEAAEAAEVLGPLAHRPCLFFLLPRSKCRLLLRWRRSRTQVRPGQIAITDAATHNVGQHADEAFPVIASALIVAAH